MKMEENIREPLDEWNCQVVGNIMDSKTMLDDTEEPAVNVEENGANEELINGNFDTNNKGSIAERRAVKCGFNASSMSIAELLRVATTTSAMSPPPARPTFLTIPPGLTPAALLDSPVMLPNSQAPQSPTTGSFQFPSIINQENSMTPYSDHLVNIACPIKTQVDHHPPISFPSSSNTQSQTSRDQFEFPAESPKVTALKNCSSDTPPATNGQENMSCIGSTNTQIGNCPNIRVNQFEQRGAMAYNNITSNSSDDGYTWRKYGQKHVKGSEFPRSYYKCTQQNCPVKKKVERSPDGQITEIVYKGAHNHQKVQPTRRATMSSCSYGLGEMSEMNEGIWRNVQFGANKDGVLDRTSSASVLTEVSDQLMSNNHQKNMNVFESAGTTPEPSSTLASRDDEDEDRATEGSTSLGDDADDCEFEHKRRRREFYSAETSLSSRTAREPRVVVQIESEIDILDDGYRWRKYGQKVVKGNPNPRSYYKCTSAGCPVRKHVERAPDNLKSVITTYEGKHNHEVPSANKTTNNAATGNQASASTTNGQSSMTSPKIHKISNLGMQVQDFNLQFERKPFDYVRPSFLGSHLNDLRFGGASSIYDLKFPNLQSPLSYNTFLSRPFTPLQMPDFPLPLSLPMSLPVGHNVPPLGGFQLNNFPLTPSGVSSHSTLAVSDQCLHNDNNNNRNSRLVKVNEEMKNESIYDHQNGASSAVFCGNIMDSFPS